MGRVKAQREGMAGLPDRIYRRISSFVNETVGLVARITGYVSGLSLSLSLVLPLALFLCFNILCDYFCFLSYDMLSVQSLLRSISISIHRPMSIYRSILPSFVPSFLSSSLRCIFPSSVTTLIFVLSYLLSVAFFHTLSSRLFHICVII